jgi:hypothetical protein
MLIAKEDFVTSLEFACWVEKAELLVFSHFVALSVLKC